MQKKRILFVCTGNTCRSVIAEMLFKKMAADELKKNPGHNDTLGNLNITSAGIAPIPGMNTAPGTIKVLKEEGIDASGHKAKRLTRDEARSSSIILVMEKRQKHEVFNIMGCCKDKIHSLNEFINENEDIYDPFGNSMEIYAECRDAIKKALRQLLNKIIKKEILS
jgi:protein-tyrosine-phosphatase